MGFRGSEVWGLELTAGAPRRSSARQELHRPPCAPLQSGQRLSRPRPHFLQPLQANAAELTQSNPDSGFSLSHFWRKSGIPFELFPPRSLVDGTAVTGTETQDQSAETDIAITRRPITVSAYRGTSLIRNPPLLPLRTTIGPWVYIPTLGS
jgi:hypothetical protein